MQILRLIRLTTAVALFFTASGTTPTGQQWLGFGTDEDPQDRNSSDNDTPWTRSDWALTTSRLGFMRPGLTRINISLGWFNPSGDLSTFDWRTWSMDNLYQVLSWYHRRGLAVQIGMWHDILDGPPDDPRVYTSTAFADAQAALVKHLVKVQGYTNIYGYAGINEWNCSYMLPPNGLSFSQWRTATRNLKRAFASHGLSTALTGPDTCGGGTSVEYAYGLDMFDYGLQVLRSGVAGALAWCLDGFDSGKNCGMWDISRNNGGTALRPWFYTWSLLSRFLPPKATICTMPEPAGLRIAAARIPAGGISSHWTFALVNRNSSNAQVVTLKVPGWGGGLFDEYVYSPSSQTTNSNGFPAPYQQIWTAKAGLRAGLTVTVPPDSAVLLTTMNRSPVPEVTQPPVGHEIALQASNGYYVSSWLGDPNTPLEARARHVQAWETFDLINAGHGYVALRAHANGRYVSAWLRLANTPLEARSRHIQAWQKFKMIYNADGTVSFRAVANGDYVSAWRGDQNTPLDARVKRILGREKYNLSELS